MKLEKRSEGAGEPVSQESSQESVGKKPVIVYILLLFVAAFLLMALSFLMHQRSNAEALGELRDSVTAMQALQSTQEEIIALQKELSKANETIDALESDRLRAQALQDLYILQQQYSAQRMDDCRNTINRMEDAGLPAALPKDEKEGVPSPAACYQQIKEATSLEPGA